MGGSAGKVAHTHIRTRECCWAFWHGARGDRVVVGRRQGDFLFFFCRSLKRADKRFFFSYRDSGERREGDVVLVEYPVVGRVVVELGGR